MVFLLPTFVEDGGSFLACCLRVAEGVTISFGLPHGRMVAEVATSPQGAVEENSSFILAADRTYRKDTLNSFNRYLGFLPLLFSE
ncbi:hypothetical protein EJ110_NYTH55198 [Nymphaea thermarum]|nr:hypothetical protein EJ110_NYTH55198 [Nymphaea thermarum]